MGLLHYNKTIQQKWSGTMDLNTDPMARLLRITAAEQTAVGMITTAQVNAQHLNPYRIAHGGFAYTMGCITAALSAARCLRRNTEVAAVSSQYLSALHPGTVRCESILIYDNGSDCTYQTRITDASGRLCFSQTVTLRSAGGSPAPPADRPRTIFPAGPEVPKDPRTQLRYPMLSPGPYCELIQVYLTGLEGDTTVMGADLLPQTCDASGAAHPGLIYSVCDTGVGAASGLFGKIGVTISSAMTYFRPAVAGPLRVEVSALRMGHIVAYFETTARDADGAIVAQGRFSLYPKGNIIDLLPQGGPGHV